MPAAVFSYAGFVAAYPEFAAVAEATLAANFLKAGLYHNNTACTPVCDAAQQLALMNLVTAHITARYSTPSGAAAAADTPVGRLASAGEGSVNASFTMDYPAGSSQWWLQTKYGADYWAATVAFRSMRYRARPTVVVPGVAYGYGRGRYGWPYGGGGGNGYL